MQAVILAGGLGTRIQSAFPGIPKALISVAGTPFIGRQLELLRQHQIHKVLLCLGMGAKSIEAFVAGGAPFGLEVTTSTEDENALLGTGGALRLAYENGKLDPTFFLLNGDSYIPIDYQAIASACMLTRARPVAMTVYRNEDKYEPSNVVLRADGRVLYDKKRGTHEGVKYTHLDAGLTLIRRDWIMETFGPKTRIDLSDRIATLSEAGGVQGIEIFRPYFEIGSAEGHARLERGLRPLILLDRDGIINEEVHPSIASPTGFMAPLLPNEVKLKPDTATVLRKLAQKGCRFAICSNQPGAAKGQVTMEILQATHAQVLALLKAEGITIEASYLCLHRAEDLCSCRKPKPGLLVQAICELGAARPEQIWFVGDRQTDREAAIAAKVRPALVKNLTEFLEIYERTAE